MLLQIYQTYPPQDETLTRTFDWLVENARELNIDIEVHRTTEPSDKTWFSWRQFGRYWTNFPDGALKTMKYLASSEGQSDLGLTFNETLVLLTGIRAGRFEEPHQGVPYKFDWPRD